MKALLFNLTLLILCSCHSNINDCLSPKSLGNKELKFVGLLDSIYQTNDHGLYMAVIKSDSGVIYFKQSIFFDFKFFEQVENGDSVIKHAGFYDLIVISKTGNKKLYKYECREIVHDSIY